MIIAEAADHAHTYYMQMQKCCPHRLSWPTMSSGFIYNELWLHHTRHQMWHICKCVECDINIICNKFKPQRACLQKMHASLCKQQWSETITWRAFRWCLNNRVPLSILLVQRYAQWHLAKQMFLQFFCRKSTTKNSQVAIFLQKKHHLKKALFALCILDAPFANPLARNSVCGIVLSSTNWFRNFFKNGHTTLMELPICLMWFCKWNK